MFKTIKNHEVKCEGHLFTPKFSPQSHALGLVNRTIVTATRSCVDHESEIGCTLRSCYHN